MMKNKIKISELQLETNLKEDALIPIVQDNKTKAIKSRDLLKDITEKTSFISSQYKTIKTKVDKIEEANILVVTSIIDSTLTLTTDKLQTTTMENNTTITLPSVDKFTELHLFFSTTEELTLIFPNIKWQSDITIEANKVYEFIFTYVNGSWYGGYVSYE